MNTEDLNVCAIGLGDCELVLPAANEIRNSVVEFRPSKGCQQAVQIQMSLNQ